MARTGFERARRTVSKIAFVAFVIAAVVNDPPNPPAVTESMEIVGFALLIGAMIGRIWSALYLTGRKSKVLCTAGPFSLSRNPLYLFSFLGAIGIGLLTESFTLLAILAVSYLIYYHFVITNEEKRLAELFGQNFQDYKRCVPRLIPWKLHRYERIEALSVQTRPFMHAVLDTSMFLWAFFAFEAVEAVAVGFGWKLPVLMYLR